MSSAPSMRGELRRSIIVPDGDRLFKRIFVFLGPGYLVATGYMDPGNWATALAGGSKFGAALLFVAVLSSLMAIVLQSLSARLGVGAGLDLAQACRAHAPFPVAVGLWLLAEAGIFATDLAEVIGTAIGLQLLFGLPLALGISPRCSIRFSFSDSSGWAFARSSFSSWRCSASSASASPRSS